MGVGDCTVDRGGSFSVSYVNSEFNCRGAEWTLLLQPDVKGDALIIGGASVASLAIPHLSKMFKSLEVWQPFQQYSDEDTKAWAAESCRTAAIGCIECKGPIIDAVKAELTPIHERAKEFEADHDLVRSVINEGCDRARDVARQTISEVRQVMGLEYS